MSGRKPRIVVITTVPQTMVAFFPRQLRSLSAAGFEVHAVSSPGAELDRLGAECGIATHGIAMARPPRPIQDLVSLRRLYSLLRQIRPDVVHAHTPKAGLLGMAAAKLAGVPVRLYTVHGLPLLTRTGVLRRILEGAERASAGLSTRSYCVSHSVRTEVLSLGLCQAEKVFTLGDGSCAGVDLNRFRPPDDVPAIRSAARATLGIPQDALLVTFIGRLSKDKGIAVLADAWKVVVSKRPDLHLLLAGEEDETDPISHSAREWLRSEPSVHLPGGVPADAVPGIFAASDICVLPSFREGLSQVALEAAAMGIPMVASKVAGIVDPVLDGVTGLLVPPNEPQRLAQALLELAATPEKRSQFGRAAIEHVRAKFSAERVDRLWMNEYRSLIANAPLGSRVANANPAVVLGESKLQ